MSAAASRAALVCGFSDLASGVGGLGWRLGEEGGLMLGDDGVHEARIEVSQDKDAIELRLSSSGGEAEARLSPRTGRLALDTSEGSAPPGDGLEAAVCTAEVKPAGQGRTLRCFGHLSSWGEDPSAGAGAFRHLTIERSDGSLLLVVARGEGGAAHGDERTAAWLLDAEGGVSGFGEALLSTQYDKDSRPIRAGLELWPEGDGMPPMRAAGTRLGGTDGADGICAALLRCSTEGSDGIGSYVVRRG
jgi:hypothetical protein